MKSSRVSCHLVIGNSRSLDAIKELLCHPLSDRACLSQGSHYYKCVSLSPLADTFHLRFMHFSGNLAVNGTVIMMIITHMHITVNTRLHLGMRLIQVL